MRPVNLIPPEQRRGDQAQLRTGPLMYIVLGALALVLLGVTMLVLTGNRIADSKAEVATLKQEDAVAAAEAKKLAAYTQFRALSEQRIATVRTLADSRFDWERVMRELSLVLPSNVWLTSLSASATSSTTVGGSEGAGGSGLRGAVPGPALELSGCASGQEAVAEFVTALEDIDGVTRVGLDSSELASKKGEAGSGGGGSGDCRTRGFIAQFDLVIGFDAAPVPAAEGEEEVSTTTSTEAVLERKLGRRVGRLMKVEAKKKTNLMVGAMLLIAAVAAAFWILALSPKREEASKLDAQVTQLEGSLAQHESEVATAKEARKEFPVNYQHLVVLGSAVPSDDETPSLLVQLNHIANHAGVRFQTLKLEASGTEEAEASSPLSTAGRRNRLRRPRPPPRCCRWARRSGLPASP